MSLHLRSLLTRIRGISGERSPLLPSIHLPGLQAALDSVLDGPAAH